jgi:hypothetical protein
MGQVAHRSPSRTISITSWTMTRTDCHLNPAPKLSANVELSYEPNVSYTPSESILLHLLTAYWHRLSAEFDPDDIFKTEDTQDKRSSEESMEDSVRQYWEQKRPIKYVYDAARERQEARREGEASAQPIRTSSLHTSGGVR